MKLPRRPLYLSLAYAGLAGLWILLSGHLIDALPFDTPHKDTLEVLKGLCFVAFTGILLYLALSHFERRQQLLRQKVRQREERLERALDAAQEGLWDWDLHSDHAFFSRSYIEILGYTPESFDYSRQAWRERLHPDDRERVIHRAAELVREGQTYFEGMHRQRHRDGSYRWLMTRGKVLLENGKPVRFLGTAIDITQRRADEESLRQAAAVFDSTREGVLVTDPEQTIVHVNPAFSLITGYAPEEVLGKTPRLLRSGHHDSDFYRGMWHALEQRDNWSGEVWNRRKNGEIFPMWQSLRVIRDSEGNLTQYVAVFSDISAIKRSQNELDHLAHHDPLTTLPNRLLLCERLEQALQRAQRESQQGCLLLADLDHFKLVNEGHGHSLGDQLLKMIGARLRASFDENVTLARLGGDEYGLLIEDCDTAQQASRHAQQMLDLLAEPFLIDGEKLFVSASLGISLFPADGDSVEQLMRNADSALFRAKNSGRHTFSFYSQDMTAQARQRVRLDAELRTALAQGQLRVHYQPIHELDGLRLIGAEALVRWQHPERGLVPPSEFIPVAEDSGLVGAIDIWVLEQACAQMQQWRQQGLSLEFVAVNVSSRQFGRDDLPQQVAQVLVRSGLPAAQLELEVTESAVMDDPERAQHLLGQLRELGVRLAIDDFGTGYSSMTRLKSLPVDKLKLDQSFVRGLPDDRADAAIARAVITLGQSLGLRVLAEGIETEAQAQFLREIGCRLGQGYWFGRPAPAEQLTALQPGPKA